MLCRYSCTCIYMYVYNGGRYAELTVSLCVRWSSSGCRITKQDVVADRREGGRDGREKRREEWGGTVGEEEVV